MIHSSTAVDAKDLFHVLKMIVLDIDGVLTDGRLYYGADGEALKAFNVKDGMGIKQLQHAGLEVALLSNGRADRLVAARANDLGIKTFYVGRAKKLDILNLWLKERDFGAGSIAYMGDDLNDLPIMDAVGFTISPQDAAPAVLAEVDLVIDRNGGDAAVRAFADWLLADIAL